MVKVNATYLEKGKEVTQVLNVCTGWPDVSYDKYCQLLQNNSKNFDKRVLKQISILTGITTKELKTFGGEFIVRLAALTSFAFRTDELAAYNKTPIDFIGFDIGMQPYGSILKVKSALKEVLNNKQNDFFLCKELCNQYWKKDIGDMPITEVYGACNFFLIAFLNFSNSTKGLGNGNTKKKSWKQVLSNWVKGLAIFSWLTIWRKVTS